MAAQARAITGCILAGGRGHRLGGVDKGLVELAGRPLLDHVLDRFRPQVGEVIISANRNLEIYERYGDRVTADDIDGFAGPLAGFAAAMSLSRSSHLTTTPCDSPFVPRDMVDRLHRAMAAEDAEISVVRTGERLQPVFALMRTDLRESLLHYLADGERKIDGWYANHRVVEVDFGAGNGDFANINTQADLAAAEKRLART